MSPSYAAASPLASAGGAATFVGYEKNGIKIQFTVQKDPSNAQVSRLSFIVFLAFHTKSMKKDENHDDDNRTATMTKAMGTKIP